MARTAEGRRLTDADRAGANARAEVVARRAARVWDRLADPDDIDAARGLLVSQVTAESVAVARAQREHTGRYLRRFMEAEGGGQITVATPMIDPARVARDVTLAGPASYKAARARGYDQQAALALARTRVSLTARGVVLGAQRRTVTGTARANRGRWRRVTDGHPCAFCAMLATRGPVYAEDTVDFVAHGGCGCTAEMCLYDVEEWVAEYATDTELAWINAYFDAAETADRHGQSRVAPVRKKGRGEDTILYRMRRQHPDLFHDGVRTK